MMNEFEMLSRELIQLKESKEYLEQNIESLRKTMQRLNQDLRLFKEQNAIELNMEQSNRIAWDRMIYVKEKATHTTNQQWQQTVTGEPFADYRIRQFLSTLVIQLQK
jgi:archaellum component FlaC